MNVRFRFSKHGKVCFTSHRDVARMWERALRRAGVAVAYSEGFSPRPKMSFGLALPTGHASDGEYVDIRLDEEQPSLEALCARLSDVLPDGVTVDAAQEIEPGGASLQEAVGACTWSAVVGRSALDATDVPTTSEVRTALERILTETELPVRRERKGKERVDDLRPAVLDLTVDEEGPDQVPTLTAVLTTRPASFRPEELVEVLDPSWRALRVCRRNQWIIDGDSWQEPVPLVVPPQRTEVRAS